MDEDDGRSTAELVAALRVRRSLTQEGLARELGVAFSTVNAWETGRSRPQTRHRRRLLELAGETFGSAEPQRVLLVDDVDTDLRIGARAVRKAAAELGLPVEVVTERDPLRALVQLGRLRPTATIVDVFMPVFDGFELADRCAELPGLADVRLVLATAGRDADVEAAATRRGLQVLDKPLRADDVAAVLWPAGDVAPTLSSGA